ncbi:phosphoenolpyruvate--protein phosphotransferase [Flexivirga sp. ID2601S]|uniref:Phosphoenolpyruvate-protein phosphotransferase n=1 Tax=Flexivirga aerilata TaxID=1656889 RepID=A0A849AFS7_9MICO|nr:phosphoenolpyruvate--protein phosphotransferase [Flexivirga aerilata]
MSRELHGVPVSPGWAVGKVVQVTAPPPLPAHEEPTTAVDATKARVADAFEAVATSLDRRAQSATAAARDVLQATAMIARDKTLRGAVDERISTGSGPLTAVAGGVEQISSSFIALGGYFADRAIDVRDVGNRVVARLLGAPDTGVPPLTEPCVLVAHDLAPADTATLNSDLVQAVVLAAGGRGGHTAIIAAQLGIPAAVQVAGATALARGTVVAVDGDTGTVTVDPDDELREALQHKAAARMTAASRHTGPGRTKDGHPVALLANIGTPQDAQIAAATDVEGVGLFRTEVLFLGHHAAPTVEEQTEIYREALAPFGDRPVVVRTLDAGADKPLDFATTGETAPEESNPALGVRGLRLSLRNPDLLTDQLRALARAAELTGTPVRVMAPMVSTTAEATWFAEQAHEQGLASVGVMIEVPAAALRAENILGAVDFGSVGTNDLAQYTMAADRTLGPLAELLDPWQPATLDLLARAADGARAADRPLGVCGESAGDPLMACVLTGLGVSSLSMTAGRVGLVRFALGTHTLATCREMASAARAADSALLAREAALRLADDTLRDLL